MVGASRDRWGDIVLKECAHCGDLIKPQYTKRKMTLKEYASRVYCSSSKCRARGRNKKHRDELLAWLEKGPKPIQPTAPKVQNSKCSYCGVNPVSRSGAEYCKACEI